MQQKEGGELLVGWRWWSEELPAVQGEESTVPVNGLKLFNGLPDHMKVPNLNRNLFKKRLEHVKRDVEGGTQD
jgi:hypothetical protein